MGRNPKQKAESGNSLAAHVVGVLLLLLVAAACLKSETGPGRPASWEMALRWLAGILAALAVGQTAFHLIVPRLSISDRTLAIARKHLIQTKQQPDFDFLAVNPVWKGQQLKTLLAHVELANYNRELVNWKCTEELYREFVLSPMIAPEADREMNWRRPLWESLYPRVRREQNLESAAQVVVRHRRERVTIASGETFP